MKTYRSSLGTAIACSLIATAAMPAFARSVEFSCPDLHNEKKRSIEPLFQGYDGWFFRNNDLKMDFSISPEVSGYFGRLNKALEAKGVKLVLVPLLGRAMMAPDMVDHENPWQENYNIDLANLSYTQLVDGLNKEGVQTISLLDSVNKTKDKDPYLYNFKRDIHWKPEGARRVADVIGPVLQQVKGHEKFSTVNTTSKERAEPVGRAGTITEELQKLCTDKIEAEPFTPYDPVRTDEKSADALFGSGESAVPIALVGTSFSAVDEFNFLPFLEESSKYEIANFSIAGGGIFTSLISYLASPFFHENVPPVIVWETQAVYDFNDGTENGFRQAIPAVSGPCTADRTLAHKTLELTSAADGETDKSFLLFDGLKNKNIRGSDYYLHIVSDNLGFKQFTLEMEYDDKDGEWFPVDRSDRYNNKGHYYIELSDKISGNLDKVVMKDTRNTLAKLDVTLCKKAAIPAAPTTEKQ